MRIQLDQELLNYKLYEDLLKLNKGSLIDLESSLEYSLSKLPKSVDYKIPAIEKLIECLKLNGEDGYDEVTLNYIINDFLISKGTYRVRDLLTKYLGIKIVDGDDGFKYGPNMSLSTTLEVTYSGDNVELLISLIQDLLNFELFFTNLDLVIKKLVHEIEINSKNTVRVNKFRFNKLNGVILWH